MTVAAVAMDILALAVALVLVANQRQPRHPLDLGLALADHQHTLRVFAVLLPIWLATYIGRGMYGQELLQHGTALVSSVANAVTLAALLTLGGSYLAAVNFLLSADLIVAIWGCALVLTILLRLILLLGLRRYRRYRPWRVLIAGASQTGVRAAMMLLRRPDVRVVGFVDDYLPLGTAVIPNGRVLGRPADLIEVAGKAMIDEVLVVEGALGCESDDRLWRDAYTLPGMPPLRLVPSPGGELLVRMRPGLRGRVPILVPEQRHIAGLSGWAKAALDRSVALVVLIAAAPLLFAAGCWTLLRRRPLLHGVELVGRDGRRFRRWSLAAWGGANTASAGTLRLTGSAAAGELTLLLRKLPRALNVLRGDLSLVGPRPLSEEEMPLYSEWTGVLLSMRPGLFGPWLLHGDSTLTPEEELMADLAYVRNFSLASDLSILVRACRRLAARVIFGRRRLQREHQHSRAATPR